MSNKDIVNVGTEGHCSLINCVEERIRKNLEIVLEKGGNLNDAFTTLENTLQGLVYEGILIGDEVGTEIPSCKDPISNVKCIKVKQGKHFKPFYNASRW